MNRAQKRFLIETVQRTLATLETGRASRANDQCKGWGSSPLETSGELKGYDPAETVSEEDCRGRGKQRESGLDPFNDLTHPLQRSFPEPVLPTRKLHGTNFDASGELFAPSMEDRCTPSSIRKA
jgi:hypothetical protein